jgi:hypothetical protein
MSMPAGTWTKPCRIAGQHYLQVTEEHFAAAAAGGAAESGARALQKPVQQLRATPRTDSQDSPKSVDSAGCCETLRAEAAICDNSEYAWQDSNLQPSVP